MAAKEIQMEADRLSFENRKVGPIPIAEILPAVLARYALAGTLLEDTAAIPAGDGISTVTVVEVRT
jgi:hypothetical protein